MKIHIIILNLEKLISISFEIIFRIDVLFVSLREKFFDRERVLEYGIIK